MAKREPKQAMRTTAVWGDTSPISRSVTQVNRLFGYMMGCRKVRRDGTVRFRGRVWRPKSDTKTMPVPGEWLLFADYGPDSDTLYEFTAPADRDGCIRRMFWVEER